MTEGLPHPLTSPDCDLRDFPFMPLEVGRLRRSKAWLIAKREPALAFYMLNLWAASWHEVPAASLEDDDDVLADLAMCEPRQWSRLRDRVMRGWVKCSDGRLYHPVVAEKAIESFERKQGQRQRTERARQVKSQRLSASTTGTVTTPVTESVTASKGQYRQGQYSSASKANGESYPRARNTREAPQAAELRDWFANNMPAAAREYDPMKTGMADLKCVEGHPCVNGYFVDGLFDRCVQEAGMHLQPSLNAWQPLIGWLAEGYVESEIVWLIRKLAARDDYQPPRSLAYFTKAVHEDCRKGLRDGYAPWHE